MNRRLSALARIWVFTVFALACRPVTQIGDGPAEGDAGADSDVDGDVDGDGDSDICDAKTFGIEVVPARIMVLLDGSPSMGEDDKWNTATGAISDMVLTWAGQIHFGFDDFPSSDNCSVTAPVVMDVDTSGSMAMISMMPGGPTGGSTPLYCGISNFLDPEYAPIFSSTEADSYLVVVSDGADLCGKGCCVNPFDPNCRLPGNSAPVFAALATDLTTGENPIMIFSIGLSGDNPEDLNALAKNGGTGYDSYFDARHPGALNTALAEIAAQTVSCTYNFSEFEPGTDRNKINVYFDDAIVGYDKDCAEGKGWNWVDAEHTEIEFCEQACEHLKAGSIDQVRAEFGCATIVV
ncbi:MAG: VWA domain-containing protein [Deltaproteobacteria bacterium]|nr:VWA domain-containing protein [Deltaproteobacteria bacterium]